MLLLLKIPTDLKEEAAILSASDHRRLRIGMVWGLAKDFLDSLRI